MSPWLIRSMLLFNMPFYSEAWNMGYVYTKAGLGHLSVEETIHAGLQEKLIVLKHAIFPWLPNNLFYGARKLFLLTPIAFFFACFGLVDVWFSRERLRSIAPLIILLAFHTLVVAAYPVWKFRYFVPMLPLVFLFALDQLWHIRIAERTRNLLCGGVLVAVLAVSVWTYIETAPAHTTYYDGAMTQDPFHANEEKSFQESYHISFPNDAP